MMRAVDADATALVHRTMPLCATLDVVAHEFGRDRVVLGLGWRPELCTSNGLLHGGAVMVLADSAGAACAFAKTNFVGAVTAGTVVATSTVLHRGSTTIVIETDVRDDADRLVAKVTQTQIVLRPRASAP
jgi:1,4-dihydroxy-2-naphthoyl-CoA hydrolase